MGQMAEASAEEQVRNVVQLRGRLTGEGVERELPSGDVLVTFRVTVPRDPDASGERSRVDTIDCVARKAGLRRSVLAWSAGDVVEVEGSLRHRFWRSAAGGPASRYEVDALVARRVARGA